MENYDIDALFTEDWVGIHQRVLNYARRHLAGLGLTLTSILGKGLSAEELVDQAIAELLDAPQTANWSIGPELQVKRRVRQLIHNCLNHKDNRSRESTDELIHHAIVNQPGPDDPVEVSEEVNRIYELLLSHPRVDGKEDFRLVINALESGVNEPDKIAVKTGINKKRVYDIRQVLVEIYPLIRKQMTMAGEQA